MPLPIHPLPIVEKWDCHGCGRCCRGTLIRLNEEDLRKLRDQDWEHHSDFRGRKVVERRGLRRPEYFLAKQKDGRCIFLEADGWCRIHRELGFAAKPLVCRMAPLQLVPIDDFAYLTLRRYCPSAAADDGRTVEEHLDSAREMAEQGGLAAQPAALPPVVRRRPASAQHFLRAADCLESMLRDERFPLVRRLVHGLQLCDHLERCRLDRLSSDKFDELLTLLGNSSIGEAAGLFRDRQEPRPPMAVLFRQAALEYARLYPKFVIEQSWLERWRLVRAAAAFTRGCGTLPTMHACFPAATFEALERPLGPLEAEVLRPLTRLFETTAASKHYALLSRPGWSLVESFRSLALGYPLAMWLLRWTCIDREPQPSDMIDIVCTIDRGQSFPLLAGRRHRGRVKLLARRRELAKLVVWYAQ